MTFLLTVLTDPRDPAHRRDVVVAGTNVLAAVQAAGLEVTAVCGGRGRCTSCRIKFVAGTPPPPTLGDEVQLGADLVRDGYRLACQCHPSEAATVQLAPPLVEEAFQILAAAPGAARASGVTIDAGVAKQVVKVEVPRDEHRQTSDAEQLLAAIGDQLDALASDGGAPAPRRPAARTADALASDGGAPAPRRPAARTADGLASDGGAPAPRRPAARTAAYDVGVSVLASLPAALRDDEGQVTVTTFGRRVLAVERGDTALMKFGLAVDVGTTSVVTTLLELESGEQLAAVSSLNPQAVFGGDLMSRIAYAQFDPGHLRKLTTRIVGLLNQHVAEVCREAGVLPKWIYKAVIVGNTCMHHLLLGIDPSYVGLAPYAPVMRQPLVLPARDVPLKIAPEARVCLLPIVAGFVGADAVAVALATRIYAATDVRVAVDIGTNGEVLLGSRDRLWACSAPAGPAFEGAQIRHGMRGAAGAIDRVTVDDDVHVHTIGETDPLGICGSGLIDLLAGLLDAGVIDWTGLIQVEGRDALPPRLADRVVMRGEERQFVVRRAGESGAAREIVLTQDDVRQVQLAKGAIASGVAMLLHVAGVPLSGVAELMLAGGFGNYVSIPSAIRIGLIPALPAERVRYVGNAAALGAQLCLLSEAERSRATEIAARIEHVSLAAHPDFEQIFVDCMNFPAPAR